MDTTEFGRVFNGVNLFLKGKFDAEKYHWKTKQTPRGLAKPALAKAVDNEYEARVLALACAFSGITWWELNSTHIAMKDNWIKRIENPELAVKDLAKFSDLSFEELIKDGTRGAPLQLHLLSSEIHFVTFAYVVLTTHCTKHWNSLYWKTQKEHILNIVRGLDIDVGNVIQFAKLLRKEMQ